MRAIVLLVAALALVLAPAAVAQVPPVLGEEPPAEGPAEPEPTPPATCNPDLQDCGEPCSPDVDDACAPECETDACVGTGPGVTAPEPEPGEGAPGGVPGEGGGGGDPTFVGDGAPAGAAAAAGVTEVSGARMERELPATGGEALVLALAGLALLAAGLSLRLRVG